MKKLYFYDHALFEKIAFAEEDDYITNLYVGIKPINEPFILMETDLIKKAHDELVEYFNKERENFDIPLNPSGKDFQKKVWKELEKIPYGTIKTYKEIAKNLDTKDYQAISNAINKNPLPIFIPCHRVINNDGLIGNYSLGSENKKYLLILEKIDKPVS